jgi:hypothetical protein
MLWNDNERQAKGTFTRLADIQGEY